MFRPSLALQVTDLGGKRDERCHCETSAESGVHTARQSGLKKVFEALEASFQFNSFQFVSFHVNSFQQSSKSFFPAGDALERARPCGKSSGSFEAFAFHVSFRSSSGDERLASSLSHLKCVRLMGLRRC